MSIQIIEIQHPLNDKSDFQSRIISYSDFGSYVNDLKYNTKGTRVFKSHINRLNMYFTKDDETIVHQAWVVTNT